MRVVTPRTFGPVLLGYLPGISVHIAVREGAEVVQREPGVESARHLWLRIRNQASGCSQFGLLVNKTCGVDQQWSWQ